LVFRKSQIHAIVDTGYSEGDFLFGTSQGLSEKIIEKWYPVLQGKLGGVG